MKKTLALLATSLAFALGTTESQAQIATSEVDGAQQYYLYRVGKGGVVDNEKGFVAKSTNKLRINDGARVPIIFEKSTSQSNANGDAFYVSPQGHTPIGWLVENWDDDYVYSDVGKTHGMHRPWRFVPVSGMENTYQITVSELAPELGFNDVDRDAGMALTFNDANWSIATSGTGDYYIIIPVAITEFDNLYTKFITLSQVPSNNSTAQQTFADVLATHRSNVDNAATIGAKIEAASAGQAAIREAAKTYINAAQPTKGNQFDITFMIANPDFSFANSNGWTVTRNEGAFNLNFWCCEFFNNTYDIKQTVTGLPVGTYKLKVQAFQRQTSFANSYGLPVTAMLYVNSTTATIKSVFDDGVATSIGAPNTVEQNGLIMPNGMEGAQFYFIKGLYDNEVTASVMDAASGITFGFKNEVHRASTWTIFDNFRLYYTGVDYTGYEEQLTAKIESAKTKATELTGKAPQGVIDALNGITYNFATLETGDFNTVVENFNTAMAEVDAKIADAQTYVAPFATFNFVKNAVAKIKAQTDVYTDGGSDVKTLDDAVKDAEIAANAAKSIAEVNAATTSIRTAIATFIKTTNIKGKYFDLTSLIVNPGFDEANNAGWTHNVSADNFRYMNTAIDPCVEIWNGTYDYYQTITNLPDGMYKVQVNAFYRPNDDNNPQDHIQENVDGYLYANVNDALSASKALQVLRSNIGIENLSNAFNNNEYLNEIVSLINEENVSLTFGLKCTEQRIAASWTMFDDFKILYTAEADYSDLETKLQAAVNNAHNTATELDGTVPAVVKYGLTGISYGEEDLNTLKTGSSYSEIESNFNAAIADINAKIAEAQTYVAPYSMFVHVKNAVSDIINQTTVYTDNGGKVDALNSAVASAETKANTTDISVIDAATTDIRTAIATFIKATNIAGKYFDLTSLIVNPGFDTSKDYGWTYAGGTSRFNYQLPNSADPVIEFFNGTYNLNQAITGMPAGTYKVQVSGLYRPNNQHNPNDHIQANVDGYLYIGNDAAALKVLKNEHNNHADGAGVYNDNAEYLAYVNGIFNGDGKDFYLNEVKTILAEDGNVTFGVKCENQRIAESWTMLDDFKVLYTVEDVDGYVTDYNNVLATAKAVDLTPKMNKDVKAALETEIAKENSVDKTNVNALIEATNAINVAMDNVEASIAAYAQGKVAIDAIQNDAEIDNTNFVTADAKAELQTVIDNYDNGVYTDEEVKAIDVNAIINNYLLSAWKDGETPMANANPRGALYINTWSTEADVSGFVTRFYEFADGWGGTTIAHTFTASIDGVEPGMYKVEIWARTQMGNGSNSEPNNIILALNEGNSVKVTGEVSGGFRHGHYTVFGEVKNDGVLTLTLNIPEHTTGTWLSFKHVNYSKVENVEVGVKVEANSYATRIFPFATELPEGITAYTCEGIDENDMLVLAAVAQPQANVPYILANSTSSDVETTVSGLNMAAADTYNTGLLTGVYTACPAPAGSYVLQKKEGKMAFYQVASGQEPTIGAYRAFLTAPAGSEAKVLSFGGEATGISAIEALQNGEAEIYTINGTRMNTLHKGINIVRLSNGKTQKILVK